MGQASSRGPKSMTLSHKLATALSAWQVIATETTSRLCMARTNSTTSELAPLFDKTIEGFGEVFRALSFDEIGSSTVQSRAIAGLANRTAIFCMPGSTGACRTAWVGLIKDQLDEAHRPCNFVKVLRSEV